MENAFKLLKEIMEKKTLSEIADVLSLHIGTVKRWVSLESVPVNYYNDLNSILNHKYKDIDTYRSKDQFFTKNKIAKYCIDKAIIVLKKVGIDTSKYTFIEPSAGSCNFYSLLPKKRRIGIDIEPKGELAYELIKKDYLKFSPEKKGNYIVIGNPPFGLRGNLALRFINHSFDFADVVAFILPPLFDSTGKGVPMKRVNLGYKLIHTEKLPLDSYFYPDGRTIEIATIFQVWSKIGNYNLAAITNKDYSKKIKIYSMSNGKSSSSKRNVDMIGRCDFYLPSTCFCGMKPYKSFKELPNKRGYGIVIYKNKKAILKKAYSIDWTKKCFVSTNSALNLRTDLILKAIFE